MRKTISESWLKKECACQEGIDWWKENGSRSVVVTLKRLHERPNYAKWLVAHLLSDERIMAIRLAVFSAKLCLDNFDGDKTLLITAIKAAEKVIKNDCEQNRKIAQSAQSLAWSAAWSAPSAPSAQSLAWSVAESAAQSAASWSAAENAARSAAWSATQSALSAQRAARSSAWRVILDEFIRMISEMGE